MSTYLGVGQVEIQGTDSAKPWVNNKVDIRVWIQKCYWYALGYPDQFYYRVHIWLKYRDGSVQKDGFDLWNDTSEINRDKEDDTRRWPIPDEPPRRIAFWREVKTVKTKEAA